MKKAILLDIKDLIVEYNSSQGLFKAENKKLKAVDSISFKIKRGTTVGLVGESGSGKTTIGRAIIKLSPITSGKIYYNEKEISSISKKEFFPYKKKIQMIFQDCFHSLNPRMTLFEIIAEPLEIHFSNLKKLEKERKVIDLLEMVKLNETFISRYPHELSGGQRQRVGIARALAVEPEFLICDEPVSALDVSVQAEIINLLKDLQEELGLTYLFIGHDLAIIEHVSNQVIIMENGKIVEHDDAESIYSNPKALYTKKLLEAVPKI